MTINSVSIGGPGGVMPDCTSNVTMVVMEVLCKVT